MRKGALTHEQVNRQNVRTLGTFKRTLREPLYREINWLSQVQRTGVMGLSPYNDYTARRLVKFKDVDICSTHGPSVDDELAASYRPPGCSRAW